MWDTFEPEGQRKKTISVKQNKFRFVFCPMFEPYYTLHILACQENLLRQAEVHTHSPALIHISFPATQTSRLPFLPTITT